MTFAHLAYPSDRQWLFQEQRIRATLAIPSTHAACVEPLTEAQQEARAWTAAKASHMRAAALRQQGDGDAKRGRKPNRMYRAWQAHAGQQTLSFGGRRDS